jgi:hypothetical protein
MPLAGDQLTIKEALALCNVVGFEPKDLDVAVAVMCAESGRYTGAWHDNLREDGSVASTDRGLYQINSIHDQSISPEDAMDPVKNAAYAFALSKHGDDWSPWMAFNSGAHEKFLAGITEVRQNTEWRSRRKLWQ